MPLPLKIFINYRRDDCPESVKSIRDKLAFRYGEDNVFMDLNTPNFTRFLDYFKKIIKQTDVLIAFIGPRWRELLEDRGKTDEQDILVDEIKQALGQTHTLVATVCIDGGDIPSKESLPDGIQEMLEFQIPKFHSGEDIEKIVRTIVNDIEAECERRNIATHSPTDNGSLMHEPPGRVDQYLVDQIDANNITRIKKLLREFPYILVDAVANVESSQVDELLPCTQNISAIGTVLVVYDQHDLFCTYLQSLQQVCTLAYDRYPNGDQRTSTIWNEVLMILYYLGALAVRENKAKQLSTLMHSAVTPLNLDLNPRHWFIHLQRNRARPLLNYNALLIDIINSIKSGEYLYRQFANYEDALISHVCQCDFIHCLFLDLVANGNGTVAWPYFGIFYLDRIAPIFEKIVANYDSWRGTLGLQVDDRELALSFVRCCFKSNQVVQKSNEHPRPLWDNSVSRTIVDFLSTNLTRDEMYRWRYEM